MDYTEKYIYKYKRVLDINRKASQQENWRPYYNKPVSECTSSQHFPFDVKIMDDSNAFDAFDIKGRLVAQGGVLGAPGLCWVGYPATPTHYSCHNAAAVLQDVMADI